MYIKREATLKLTAILALALSSGFAFSAESSEMRDIHSTHVRLPKLGGTIGGLAWTVEKSATTLTKYTKGYSFENSPLTVQKQSHDGQTLKVLNQKIVGARADQCTTPEITHFPVVSRGQSTGGIKVFCQQVTGKDYGLVSYLVIFKSKNGYISVVSDAKVPVAEFSHWDLQANLSSGATDVMKRVRQAQVITENARSCNETTCI